MDAIDDKILEKHRNQFVTFFYNDGLSQNDVVVDSGKLIDFDKSFVQLQKEGRLELISIPRGRIVRFKGVLQ